LFHYSIILLELLALSEIIGVVGSKYLVEQVNALIYENLIKIKAIVVQNKEVLQSLRINFDRPDMMKDLYKRLESNFSFSLCFKNFHIDY
jgi:NCK-associated protein 1